MVTLNPVWTKYAAYIACSLLLWLLPTAGNLPPLFGIICLVGSVAGFALAAREGFEMSHGLKQRRMKGNAAKELDLHELATRTYHAIQAIEREIEAEFNPTPIANSTRCLPPAPVQLDPETQAYVDKMTELSREIGWITPSILKRRCKHFRQFKPEEIRDFFHQLASNGIGTIQGTGDATQWNHQ